MLEGLCANDLQLRGNRDFLQLRAVLEGIGLQCFHVGSHRHLQLFYVGCGATVVEGPLADSLYARADDDSGEFVVVAEHVLANLCDLRAECHLRYIVEQSFSSIVACAVDVAANVNFLG